MSAYKIETWLKKGFTLEESKYQIAIRRPSTLAYYQHKFGVSEEQAAILREQHQKKTAAKRAALPTEKQREFSHRCVEYWIAKGFNAEEAAQKVKEVQSTFSKDICILKYGTEKGIQIWTERQEKWQATLDSKTDEEKHILSVKKNSKKIKQYLIRYGAEEGKKRYIECLKNSNCNVFLTLEEIETYIIENYKPFDVYLPHEAFVKKYIPNYYWELVEKPVDVYAWLDTFLSFKAPDGEIIFKGNSKHGIARAHYNMYVGTKLLRSSNEIYFYQVLREFGLQVDVDFIIEKYYNDTLYRCDFYLVKGNEYVELAGYTDATYVQHMLYKKATFGSIILDHQRQHRDYISKYISLFYENNGR